VHCSVANWTAWTKCSKSCGTGKRTRTRQITQHARYGGYFCPALSEAKSCNEVFCPEDCKLSKWSKWSVCSKSCDNGNDLNRLSGKSHRSRSIVAVANFGGKLCQDIVQTNVKQCNTFRCPVQCVYVKWDRWSQCSVSCAGGTKTRVRTVGHKARFGGSCSKKRTETKTCNHQACPSNCKMSAWTAWSKCSAKCATGTQSRRRSTLVAAARGGKQCPANVQYQVCNVFICPVDCKVTAWSKWNTCSATCGMAGFKRAKRKITGLPKFNGKKCPPIVKLVGCNRSPCPVDCKATSWSKWGHSLDGSDGAPRECSNKCGAGRHSRKRTIIGHPKFGGKKCGSTVEARACTGLDCSVQCETTKWSTFTKCNAKCGGGMTSRSRSIVSHAKHGGYKCPVLVHVKRCNTQACPIDCTTGGWSVFTSCSHTCGTKGEKWRIRRVVKPAKHGGSCGALKQMQSCGGGKPCAVDCVQNARRWDKWSLCSKACGPGTQTRLRTVVRKPAHGGKPCTAVETRKCQVKECGCSHVRCEMRKNAQTSKFVVVVKHHQLERMGNHHTCKLNHRYNDCECICKQR
jgi:hypothetical protein